MFQPGNKHGKGRPSGSPNKATLALRETVGRFLAHNLADVQKVYDDAGEREKLSFLVQLLKFALPVLQSTELVSDLEAMSDVQLNYVLTELKAEMKENMKSNGRGEE